MFSLPFSCHDLEAMSRQNFIGKNILVHLSSFSCDRRIFFVHLTLFLSRETNLGGKRAVGKNYLLLRSNLRKIFSI